MKILLVYPGYIVREVPLNIMYVSAALTKHNNETKLFHFSKFKDPQWLTGTKERIIKDFRKTMEEFNPEIVGFSVMVQDYLLTKELTKIVKTEYNRYTVWGGIEPILEPERCLSEPYVDFVCTGEGERVFPELVEKLVKNESNLQIKGIWYKDSQGQIIKTGRPSLIENLDEVPFPDRDLFPSEYYKAELTGANILTSRGCPFPCTHCQNKKLMEIFKDEGTFVRYRSLENIFAEMREIIDKYDSPSFYMSDEMFTLNKKRVLEFCSEYPNVICRPFMVQTRVDYFDDEVASALSKAGCFMVNLAIESGNDFLRCDVLNKKISREQIKNAFQTAKKYGLKTASYNMIGIPGETIETIKETININREVKPDRIMCSIYMPLPGTELGEQCEQQKIIQRSVYETTNYYNQAILNLKGIRQRTLIGYQGFFDYYVSLPYWSYPAIHLIRIVYEIVVSPKLPDYQPLVKIRESFIEIIYKSKNFLPGKHFHVYKR